MKKLLLTVFAVSIAVAQGEIKGEWKVCLQSEASVPYILVLDAQGTYQWGKEQGRWMTSGDHVWLLRDEVSAGAKWRYKVKEDTLIFSEPEDFKYLGEGQYLYFHMTNPISVVKFSRENHDTLPAYLSGLTLDSLYALLKSNDEQLTDKIFAILEEKGEVGLKFLWQDKSGSVYKPYFASPLSDEMKRRYFLYKLFKGPYFYSAEKECVLYELGKLGGENVPFILKSMKGELNLNCIIVAADIFGKYKAEEALDYLIGCLYPGYLEARIQGPFDESKAEEAKRNILGALREITGKDFEDNYHRWREWQKGMDKRK